MTTKGDSSRPFRLVSPGGSNVTPPEHWPNCPAYLSDGQRRRYLALCERLDVHGMLADSDRGDIEALAIAEDNLESATLDVNVNGKYTTVVKQGRPYQCPACKGSGVRPVVKRSTPPPTVEKPAAVRKVTGRPCSICGAANRPKIDAALGRGESFGSVSKRYGVSKAAAYRHKLDHLGRPSRPVLVAADDPTCHGCAGKGVIIPEMREVVEKRPETTDQRYAIDQVAMLSAKLGLDVTSRVRVKGRMKEAPGPSALRDLLNRRHAAR